MEKVLDFIPTTPKMTTSDQLPWSRFVCIPGFQGEAVAAAVAVAGHGFFSIDFYSGRCHPCTMNVAWKGGFVGSIGQLGRDPWAGIRLLPWRRYPGRLQ